MQSPLKTSPRGLALIRSFETFSPVMYVCPAGKKTVGYGHVIRDSQIAFQLALQCKALSEQEAEVLLQEDVKTVEVYLNAVLPDWIQQHHFDALVSFTFNVGVGNFDTSTLKKRIKANDRPGAGAEFSKWVFAGQKRLNGLVIRRACEALMFAAVSDSGISNERARLGALLKTSKGH